MSRTGRDPPVVVVTGASAGVGRATALRFAARGARLGLLARGRDTLELLRQEVEARGARAIAIPTDVAEADRVEAAAAAVEDAYGPIDIWINNAMVSVFSPVRELEPDEVRRVTEVTYLGTVHGTLAALRRMLPRDRGAIVQVGSALAYRAIPLQAAYCAAKHAIQGFTESLRCELLHDGSRVHVTMVQLPALNTPQFEFVRTRLPRHPKPVPPIFQPEVAAEAIEWAALHPRRELWVASSTVRALVGDRLAPGLLDRYLARNGYDAQQTAEPVDPARADNLWEPLSIGRARGRFDAEARNRSIHLAFSKHRTRVGLAVGGALALVAGLERWKR